MNLPVIASPILAAYQDFTRSKLIDKGHDMNVLHCSLGISTEPAEMEEALVSVDYDFSRIDRRNMIEECGDVAWYVSNMAFEFNIQLYSLYVISCSLTDYEHISGPQIVSHLVIEAGKMADIMKRAIFYRDQSRFDESPLAIDETKVIVILAKMLRLLAMLAETGGSNLREVLDANVAKLEKRFKKSFTVDEALNRNTNVEMEAVDAVRVQGDSIVLTADNININTEGFPVYGDASSSMQLTYQVIVNSKHHKVHKSSLSYEDVVELAHGHEAHKHRLYTVTYADGRNGDGTLCPGQFTEIKSGTIFNAHYTGNA